MQMTYLTNVLGGLLEYSTDCPDILLKRMVSLAKIKHPFLLFTH